MPQSCREAELTEIFSRFGALTTVNLIRDKASNRSRGFAFIDFESLPSARAARDAMNGTMIHGRVVRVDFSTTSSDELREQREREKEREKEKRERPPPSFYLGGVGGSNAHPASHVSAPMLGGSGGTGGSGGGKSRKKEPAARRRSVRVLQRREREREREREKLMVNERGRNAEAASFTKQEKENEREKENVVHERDLTLSAGKHLSLASGKRGPAFSPTIRRPLSSAAGRASNGVVGAGVGGSGICMVAMPLAAVDLVGSQTAAAASLSVSRGSGAVGFTGFGISLVHDVKAA